MRASRRTQRAIYADARSMAAGRFLSPRRFLFKFPMYGLQRQAQLIVPRRAQFRYFDNAGFFFQNRYSLHAATLRPLMATARSPSRMSAMTPRRFAEITLMPTRHTPRLAR